MSAISNRKNFSENINSYDLLKAAAVIIMIVDHIGFYFFPEEGAFRVIGRMCVPMWFFLVGYAQSRDMSPVLWGGGIVLAVMNPIVGLPIFPLNIVFTILIVRFVLDAFIERMLKRSSDALMGAVVLLALFLPSFALFEYGTSALALAFVGYLARHKDSLKKTVHLTQEKVAIWLICILFFFAGTQSLSDFIVNQAERLIMITGLTIITLSLYFFFKPHIFKVKNKFISFLGRYTLEIYVVHLCIFKLIAVSMGYEKFQWFDFRLLL